MNDTKKQTNIRLSDPERRALRMLAGALGISMTDWTSEAISEKWEEKFPGMDFPDKDGQIKPRKGKSK